MSHANTKHGSINYGSANNGTSLAKQQQQQFNQYHAQQQQLQNNHNQSLDVVDMSEDETSITSVKGEGFASDLSDNETNKGQQPSHLKLSQRTRIKKPMVDQAHKRPTTPMDIHQKSRQPNTNSKFKKNQSGQMGSNENIQQPTGRFNEWDPFNRSIGHGQANPFDRKKSPHNQNRSAQILQQQQQTQQQQQVQNNQQFANTQQPQSNQSGFAHTFLSTDSSPRQSSGRSQLGSANKSHVAPQSAGLGDSNTTSSNLDLIVSGQRLGGNRKEMSPTNTPRDLNQLQQQQLPTGHHKPIDLHRPFTRRLQPLDKLGAEDIGQKGFGSIAVPVPQQVEPQSAILRTKK